MELSDRLLVAPVHHLAVGVVIFGQGTERTFGLGRLRGRTGLLTEERGPEAPFGRHHWLLGVDRAREFDEFPGIANLEDFGCLEEGHLEVTGGRLVARGAREDDRVLVEDKILVGSGTWVGRNQVRRRLAVEPVPDRRLGPAQAKKGFLKSLDRIET